MKREIKRVWNLFDKRSRDLAIYILYREFGRSKSTILQHWIYNLNIQPEHQTRILEIFVKVFKRQVRLLNNIEVIVS